MSYTIKQYAQSLYDVLIETHPKDHDLVINNFISVLKKHSDLEKYEEVVEELEKLLLNPQSKTLIQVATVKQNQESEKLIEKLNKLVKDADIIHTTDEGLIGGATIKINDTLIDGSIKNSLEQLHNSLIK